MKKIILMIFIICLIIVAIVIVCCKNNSSNAEENYNPSEIIVLPLEGGNSSTELNKEELQNLMMNTCPEFSKADNNESNYSYYILYTKNNQNEVIGLAGIKLEITLNEIKRTQTHVYNEADCVFELYCNENICLDSYKIRIKVPKKKASIILEEASKQDTAVFSYQEIMQDLTGLYRVGWESSPITNEKGAAYKAHVYATIKTETDLIDEEKVQLVITSLKITDKARGFLSGGKKLEMADEISISQAMK